jgi:TonB family protein
MAAKADNAAGGAPSKNGYAKVHGDFDRGPTPRFQAVAIYPPSLEANGVQGAAVVSFSIGLDGKVADLVVANASDPAFASAARRNRFVPATKGGTPVPCKMDVLYTFPGPFVTSGLKH